MKNKILGAVVALSLCFAVSGCKDGADKTKVETRLGVLAARLADTPDLDAAAALRILRTYLEENPEVYGAAFAFAPRQADGLKVSPYVYRAANGFVEKDLAASYDYAAEAWYAEPVAMKHALWSDPYFDEGGGEIWMITYSIPVYDAQARLIGVLTNDLPTAKP
jgi:hypothetical protein